MLFVRAVNEHRRFFTKHTMQGLCTLGIVLTFPVYAIMYYSGWWKYYIIHLDSIASKSLQKYSCALTISGWIRLNSLIINPNNSHLSLTGIIVPRAMAKVTFLAETYEAISLVFFLRLLFTYMGGNRTGSVLVSIF